MIGQNWFLKLLLAVLLVVGLIFGVYWYVERGVVQDQVPAGLEDYSFVVAEGTSAVTLVDQLAEEGYIQRPELLKVYLKLHPDLSRNIQAGEYRVGVGLSSIELLESFQNGSFERKLTFIEGWRREEYARYLSQELGRDFAKEFLDRTDGLEGTLFPDTYFIDADTTPADLIAKMQDNFQQKVQQLNIPDASLQGLSLNEIVTLSSIVEREVVSEADRAIVAGILIRRYLSGWPLGADATVQYALAEGQKQRVGVMNAVLDADFEWWPRELTEADLQVESGYNTRENVGLPPTPISNPGYSSLQAVVSPIDSVYWYYLTDAEGITRYATTLEEHNQNIAQFGVSQ